LQRVEKQKENFEMETNLLKIATTQADNRRIRNSASKAGRFGLHLLEMLLAMMTGMFALYFLGNLIPAPFKSGTNLYELAMVISMTLPMVAWMIVRGHGRRHSVEMAFAMFAPVVVIIVLRLLEADHYLPWLADIGHMASFVGMIAAMLYRRDHYMSKVGHSAHANHSAIS
jgi:flagellar biosynthetic protein FliP